MRTVPPISSRVLTALRRDLGGTDTGAPEAATAIARGFVEVEAALDAHTAALAAVDRIEAAVVAAHGYPRVALPSTGTPPEHAADAASITRRLGPGPTARRLVADLHRRQATFARAARAAGLEAAQAEEARTAAELSAAAAYLLLTPAQSDADQALKLTVVIAAGEMTDEDALAFPWLYLRSLLSDIASRVEPRL